MMVTSRRAEGWRGRRRGAATALAVLAIHLLLATALWHSMRTRDVTVAPDRAALLWLWPSTPPRPTAPLKPPAITPTPPKRSPGPAATGAPSARPADIPHESEWVSPPAPVAAAPSASAASAPPAERLLDTEATRIAIRQSARQTSLQERTAQAMGEEISRTDTGLSGGVASAGKPDCAKLQAPGGLLGLPILAAMVASGKCSSK
ncbi:hypothetical protein [Ideonella sp. YS5]|uniref:hypothetical protein n=1 Tax=Ideonella sp. YS5 TaxID=3453714 RepID=UPI003EEE53BD